jgi:hypothetical protein
MSGHIPTDDWNQAALSLFHPYSFKMGEVTMNDIEKLDNVTW